MNKVTIMGNLVREVEFREAANNTKIARYTLAVNRRDGKTADFIPCVAFGKSAEFANKYFVKGTRIAVTGEIQTRSYTNSEGKKIYTWNVLVNSQEFAGPKREKSSDVATEPAKVENTADVNVDADGFLMVDDDEDILPFN